MTDPMQAPGGLLAPCTLGDLHLRNRVFVPGHTTNFGRQNRPTERTAAYHAERARGGVGLIITEAVRVHPTSAGRSISLGSFDDESIPAYAAVTEAVHAEGAAIIAQIMHAGRQANGDATRTAAWSASALPWAAGSHIPHAMGREDIATVVTAFGDAARRMRSAGFDGLEVHAGHGHLLQQFLSPVTNQRTDGYGGDLDSRLRLTREVLASVQAAVPDMPVGLRVSADEFLPGGLTPDAVVEITGLLATEFPLLYVHVSHSAYHGSWSLSTQMADMSFGHAPFRHHAALFKKALPDLPVLAVCRLDSLPEAAELIDAGEADLAGLARPHITDPHLVRKAMEGRAHETRHCLACNQACIGRVEQSLPISCVVNPEVGVEREWAGAWAAAAATPARRVLVVGGGPAGLEAALSAARAGHDVTLAERSAELGGTVAVAARVPGRERLGLLTTELVRDVRAAGVDVRTLVEVDAATVLDGGWDDVVVATGARPSNRGPRRRRPGGRRGARRRPDRPRRHRPGTGHGRRPRRRGRLERCLHRRGPGPPGLPGAPGLPHRVAGGPDHHLLPARPRAAAPRPRCAGPPHAHRGRHRPRDGHADRHPQRRHHRPRGRDPGRRRGPPGRGRRAVPRPRRRRRRTPRPPRRRRERTTHRHRSGLRGPDRRRLPGP